MYALSGNTKILRGGGTGFNCLHYRLCGSVYPNKGGSLCRYGECNLLEQGYGKHTKRIRRACQGGYDGFRRGQQ